MFRWYVVSQPCCLAGCARFVCSWFYGWLVAWTVKWLVETFISKYHYHLPLQLACICFKPRFHIKRLVDRIHANSVAPVRQDLQTKVTNAFAHLNTGAPIVRKEMVGKKKLFIWWNNFMKISTSPFKLSIDESNCQSYSATLSSVYFSRCLNPLLSLLLSYPSVWLSCLAVYSFYPTHIRMFKINSPHMCWFFSQQ